MNELYSLKEMLVDELKEYGGKGELNAGSLDTVDKLAHAVKNLDKVIENCEDGEYSGDYYPMHDGRSYARGRRYAKRDAMGRYSSRYHDGEMR